MRSLIARFTLLFLLLSGVLVACGGEPDVQEIVEQVEEAATEAAPEIEEAATEVVEAVEEIATEIADEPTAEPTEAPPEEPTAEPTEEPTAEPEPEPTTLRFGIHVAEQNLTPWNQGSGYPGYYMMTLMYDTLFWKDPNQVPQPWLVDEWEVSEDGLTWTLVLHDGVTWHDGEPLTSEDVQFTIEYLQEFPRPRYTPPLSPITSIETPDPLTVILTLSEPRASFLLQPLADLPILPQHIWSEVEAPEELNTHLPIGSGPYQMVEYEPERLWRFEANPNYFMGEPTVREIVMPFIQDSTAMFLALRTGDVDAVSQSLAPELVTEFEGVDGVEILEGTDLRGWYLYMNTARPPFDQPEFRQAILHTIDMDELVDILLLGFGTTGSPGFVHRDIPWANPATADHTQDFDRANELLDELGFEDSDGDGIRETAAGDPVSFELIVRSNDAVAIRATELVSEWAAEAGIELISTPLELQTVGSRIWPDTAVGQFQGDYFIGLHSWAAAVHLDPDFLTRLFHSVPEVGSLNRSAYSNPDYDALAEEQTRTVDPEARQELLYQMQAILAEDVPAIALYYPGGLSPYRPAAFNDWVFYNGVGILNKANFLPN